jgi:glycerophosphoryl diester phosphodiesterase
MLIKKLLSHRLRGFAEYEHTLSGLKLAIKTDIPYIEIDTRVAKDKTIYVYHDPKLGKETTSPNLIINQEDAKLLKILYKNGEKLLSFEEILSIFYKRKNKEQKLCIDIKDYGYEKEHIELVRKYDLENSVIFISWIPQVLIRIGELTKKIPLILSHWNLIKYGSFGKFLAFIFRNFVFRLSTSVIIGEKKITESSEKYDVGYQHSVILYQIPNILISLLEKNGGGICIHKSALSNSLIDYCTKKNLKLWVFSVSNGVEFRKLASIEGVDVIFCDDSTFVL